MIWQVFSVFDTKVGAYANPFFVPTKGAAIRSFTDACGDDSLPFKKHPGDYRLFRVGEWDDASGHLLTLDRPEPVMGADEIGLPDR